MYTNILGKCSIQNESLLNIEVFLTHISVTIYKFLSSSFISFPYLTDKVKSKICNPNTNITGQVAECKTINTPTNFHQSELVGPTGSAKIK